MLELIKKLETIPELPRVAYKILEEINKKEINYEKFSELIECSPFLTLKIFQIVNSPFYSLPNKINNLSQAIGLLGIKQIANIALTIFVVNILQDFHSENNVVLNKWKHIITSANAAKIFSKNDSMFLAALISRIPDYLDTLLVAEGIESKVDFNLNFYENALKNLKNKWHLSEEVTDIIRDFYILKTGGHVKNKDSIYLYASEIVADSLLLNGVKEGTLKKVTKLLKINEEDFIKKIKKIEIDTKAIFELFLNNESVDYTNIFSLFAAANSKIYKLLTDNESLLEKYMTINDTLETAFNNMPLALMLFEKGKLVMHNNEAEKLFSNVPKNLNDILDSELLENIESNEKKSIKVVTVLKNGVNVELTFIKLTDNLDRKLLFLKDLREELKIANRYKRVKENYIHLINSVGVGICITSLKGRILFGNEKFFEIFKRPEKEFIRNDIKKFFPFTKNLENIFDKLLRGKVKEEQIIDKSFDSDHNLIFLNIKISLYKEGEKIIGYQFIVSDITLQKELEQENKQLQENKIAMEVAGTTAHEINQPLTSLILSLDLINTSKNPQVIEKCLKRINVAAERIDKIVRELSRLTKYETRSYAKRHTILDLKTDNEHNK